VFTRNLQKYNSDFTKKSRLAARCSEVNVAMMTIALAVALFGVVSAILASLLENVA